MQIVKVKDVPNPIVFGRSAIADEYLTGLKGVSIGESAHNSFGLDTINVDYTDEMTIYKQAEIDMCGSYMKVDKVGDAGKLPLRNGYYDFLVSSHVLEHCWDVISVIKEWNRVIKKGGYILTIVPKPEVCPDDKVVTLKEFKERYGSKLSGDRGHCSVCTLETLIDLFKGCGMNIVESLKTDTKVGNGIEILAIK